MDRRQSYVIIGNGIAGITAAEILRAYAASADITIVADDPFPVYYRPALKDFLSGRLPEEKLWARPATFYQDQRIRFVPGRVVGIHPQQHTVQLHNGQSLFYHKLLLANGGHARTLSCPGLNLIGVSTLRTVADYQEVSRRLESVQRVVICGGGTLALESAETLRHRGYQVTHLLRGQILWSEVLDSVASDMVLQEERRDGIDVRMGEEIAEIIGKDDQVCAVVTTRGERISCELVLIAVGIEPAIDFIRASGIACGRGVQVDKHMRTNTPDIYAAGDVVETTDLFTGRTRIAGQWFPAIQQAQIAAYQMLGAPVSEIADSPSGHFYNATFLYGLDFVSIGLTNSMRNSGFSELVAEPGPRSYRKAVLYNGQIVGVLMLGDRRQALAFKRAIDRRVDLMAIAPRLFSEDFHLDEWLDQQQIAGPLLSLQSKHDAGRVNGAGSLAAAAFRDADVYLVPVPHPRVQLQATEIQLNNRNEQQQILTVGRMDELAWRLEHSSISRLHAEIVCTRDAYLLRDKGSSNGTFVNGSPLQQEEYYQLRHYDLIRFGDVQFRFELRPRRSSAHSGVAPLNADLANLQNPVLSPQALHPVPESFLRTLPDTPELVIMGPDLVPVSFSLEQGKRYLLGRDNQNDLVFSDTSVSRKHAELFSSSDGFYIRDLNSSYGVFVNGVKIQNIFHIKHGDYMVLGNILLYFSHSQNAVAVPTAVPSSLAKVANTSRSMLSDMTAKVNIFQVAKTPKPVIGGLEHREEIIPLNPAQLAFEIDMCIGCNRCMDACPLPSSAQITIAALNDATITDRVTPHLERFTRECIMCGSCVPVCPVDNHRDLLMLSLKQRLGVSWEKEPDIQRIMQTIPGGWSQSMLLQHLRRQAFLRDPQQVPDRYLLHIVAASSLTYLAPGEYLIREGEYGNNLYLLLSGQLALVTTGEDSQQFSLAILGNHEYLGEDGMLTGLPYKVSAQAQKPTLLLSIPAQVMQRLMELVPAVQQYFERYNSPHLLLTILRRMDLFKGVKDADLQWLMQSASISHYERSEHLFAEDRLGRPQRETLHILLEGFVKVARQRASTRGDTQKAERIIAYRQGGDYFAGGLDLLGDGQAVTVTTINRCRVAEVPRQAIKTLFQHYPDVEQRFALRLHEYLDAAVSTQPRLPAVFPQKYVRGEPEPILPDAQSGLHSLVSDGVVEGTEVLVIDLDKCIHCNECENACERRHGHSRMNRKGLVIGNISITTTCRQCQDPVCMLCSRAGIARHPNGEVYITESCIGCGICAERCPYGAISIANVEDEDVVSKGAWQRFSSFMTRDLNKKQARRTLPVVSSQVAGGSRATSGPLDLPLEQSGYDELRKKIAIKCDLCAGYSNQACVQACPAGAAFRIQPTRFFGSTEEILQRQTN